MTFKNNKSTKSSSGKKMNSKPKSRDSKTIDSSKRQSKKSSERPQNPRTAFRKDSDKPESPRRSFRKDSDKPESPRRSFRKDSDKPQYDKVKKEFKREKELFIWGKRTVESYFSNLHAKEDITPANYTLHIIVDKSNKAPVQLKPIVESAKTLGIQIMSHTSAEDTWPIAADENLNHQRVCLKVPEYPVSHLEDALSFLKTKVEKGEYGCHGLVLDQIQDPRNFGAILRSASFFGVDFVVYATDRQSDVTSLVLKTSAGGAFSLMLVPVVNINRALAQLKEAGAWIVGTSLQPEAVEFKQLPKDRNWVFVLGNEEKGLRNEVVKNCDYLVKIPGSEGRVESLNVSVAAGVCLHALQFDKTI